MNIKYIIAKRVAIIKRALCKRHFNRKLKSGKYTHLYMGAPYHGNLGDLQIRNSSLEFLRKNNIPFLEMNYFDFLIYKDLDFSKITTLCLQGGGNTGNIYLDEQLFRDEVIRRYRDKKIVLFPQTVYFKDDKYQEKEISQLVYGNCEKLVLTAREEVSFDEFKKLYPNNKVLLTPDIVLSSDYSKKEYKRKGALCLLRRDVEKNLPYEFQSDLVNKLSQKYRKVKMSDTVIDYFPYSLFRDKELNKMFKKIKKAELVITDRLHGMIFCAITNTPCIAFSNFNFKIESSYNNWLKNVDHIEFVTDIKNFDIDKALNKLNNAKFMWTSLDDKFEALAKEL